MTKKELRVAAAKDVIKSLRVLKVLAGNDFIVAKQPVCSFEGATSNVVAKKLQKHCTVCALGACLLSVVALDNKFNFTVVENNRVRLEPLTKRLRNLLSESQLQKIENAFEYSGGGYFYNRLNKYDRASVSFGKTIKDDKKRLRAIMRNIIANDGTFKPPKVPA